MALTCCNRAGWVSSGNAVQIPNPRTNLSPPGPCNSEETPQQLLQLVSDVFSQISPKFQVRLSPL